MMKSKDRIIFEAFKLFCLKPYDQVKFSDIEKATNLSRGAILYHFKAKENIFNHVIENYILNRHSIQSIDEEKRENLKLFIDAFIDFVRQNKLQMKKWGIKNMNMALLHAESSAYTFYPEMQEKAAKWYNKELHVWQEVVLNAVKNNEIKNGLNSKIIGMLFMKIYVGTSFLATTKLQGIEIDELQEDFDSIYNLLKN